MRFNITFATPVELTQATARMFIRTGEKFNRIAASQYEWEAVVPEGKDPGEVSGIAMYRTKKILVDRGIEFQLLSLTVLNDGKEPA